MLNIKAHGESDRLHATQPKRLKKCLLDVCTASSWGDLEGASAETGEGGSPGLMLRTISGAHIATTQHLQVFIFFGHFRDSAY